MLLFSNLILSIYITGYAIKQLTMFNSVHSEGAPKPFTEKNHMVRAARKLLSAITKVLLIADKVIVKQLIAAKDQVNIKSTLNWVLVISRLILLLLKVKK